MTSNSPFPGVGEQVAGRYTIQSCISCTESVGIYKAIQDNLDRVVSIKLMRPSSATPNYADRFREQALLTSKLRHPNTISIYDYGQDENGLIFLVTESIDGELLSDVIRREGALAYERCHRISLEILRSLSEAHELGIVHRGLSSGTIMLGNGYQNGDMVKVLDFALFKDGVSEHSVQKLFSAPETFRGKTTALSDLYSFGLILCEMLLGTLPVKAKIREDSEITAILPPNVRDTFLGRVVRRCLNEDPSKRPQNTLELLREYQKYGMNGISLFEAFRETGLTRSTVFPSVSSKSDTEHTARQSDVIFVDRESEIEEFKSIVKNCEADSKGMSLMITGPRGCGKSAILQQFLRIAQQHDTCVRTAHLIPRNQYGTIGVRDLIREWFFSSGIEDCMRQLNVGDLRTNEFFIKFLAGENIPVKEVFLKLEILFSAISKRKMLVLAVENLEWADADSLHLMGMIASSHTLNTHRVILIGTIRESDFPSPYLLYFLEKLNRFDHDQFREMHISWLAKKDCQQLIAERADLPKHISRRCVALSRGNPLDLGMILDFIVRMGDRLSDDFNLPNDMETIVAARIEQAARKSRNPHFREIMMRGAVLGESFTRKDIEDLLRIEGKEALIAFVEGTVASAHKEGLLINIFGPHYCMSHAYMAEYFEIECGADLHRSVAKKILSGSDLMHVDYAMVARHFRRAGDLPDAIDNLFLASTNALRQNNLLAAKLYDEELLPYIHFSGGYNILEKRVNIQLGDLSKLLSDFDRASDYYNKAIQLVGNDIDPTTLSKAYTGLGEIFYARRDLANALEMFENARKYMQVEKQNYLLIHFARIHAVKGEWEEALRALTQASEYAQSIKDRDLAGDIWLEMGNIAFDRGDIRNAHDYFVRAESSLKPKYRYLENAKAKVRLSNTLMLYHKSADAYRYIEEAIEAFQRTGDKRGVADAMSQMALLMCKAMQIEKAHKMILRTITLNKELGNELGLEHCRLILSMIEFYNGQFDNASALAEQALEVFRRTNSLLSQVSALNLMGIYFYYSHNYEEAERCLAKASLAIEKNKSDAYRCELMCHIALLHEHKGNFAQAEQLYQASESLATQSDWIEQSFIARCELIKINFFFSPGRWYFSELYAILEKSKNFNMARARLRSLAYLVWFEGYAGEQHVWESLMQELVALVKDLQFPATGLRFILDRQLDNLRYCSPDVSAALRKSAGWIRDAVTKSADECAL